MKNVICVITFPAPTPKFDIFLQYETYDFAHNITNSLDIPAIFISCIVFDVINEMQMLLATRTVSSYLPCRDQTLKIYIQEIKQKLVQSGLYWNALASTAQHTGQHFRACSAVLNNAHWSALETLFTYLHPLCSALDSTRQHWETHWECTGHHCWACTGHHCRAHWSAIETSFTYLHPHWSALISTRQHWEMHWWTHWSALHSTNWAALQSALVSTGNLIYIFAPALASTGALSNHVNKKIHLCTAQHWLALVSTE